MTDQTTPQFEPQLTNKTFDPRGVMQKNGKALMFVGVAALLLLAMLFSSKGKPVKAQSGKGGPPQPLVQDNTDTNVADLKRHVEDQQRAAEQEAALDPSLRAATPAQRAAVTAYGSNGQAAQCLPGQPCVQTAPYGYAQNGCGAANSSPAEQASQQLAAKERERSYQSSFRRISPTPALQIPRRRKASVRQRLQKLQMLTRYPQRKAVEA